jgi:D-alanyl-D-alanine carboxypeptidase/D-alanyl-D-alanine-endopeptidase (penicillin-binding protein 4)
MRALLIGLTLIPLAACSSAEPESAIPGLPDSAVEIIESAPYTNGIWGIHVTDAESGEVLVDYNSATLLEPASVTKTYSVGAVWLKFGPDSTITTPVVRDGEVDGGSLDGDLVLVAKGDILMGGQTGPDGQVVFTDMDHNDANLLPGATITDNNPLAGLDDLAAQVKASGIDRIDGDVIIDDRLWVHPRSRRERRARLTHRHQQQPHRRRRHTRRGR